MTERERLTELIMNTPKLPVTVGGRAQGKTYQTAHNIADHLIANGVIVPPVSVGQTVYSIEKGITHVLVGEVFEIVSNKFGTFCRSSRKWYYYHSFTAEAIGKTVFLTREEAEKALEERSKT